MATKLNLSNITPVPLRDCWDNEATDFTPWLAEEKNIALLADALGIDELVVESQEQPVGPFRADILCKDSSNNSLVLIENQLERTDHNHLGQILTYAAGLDAVTIIWIAERFTEEHRAAIDWLNRITDKDFNFFGIEIQLVKIGGLDAVAPIFKVIAKPNGWSKDVRSSSHGGTDKNTSGQEAKLEYWTAYYEFMQNNPSSLFRPQSPSRDHWSSVAIGRSHFHINLLINMPERKATVHLVMADDSDKKYFDALYKDKDKAEASIGEKLDWRRLDGKKSSSIDIYRYNCDFFDPVQRQEVFAWYKDFTERFIKYFKPIIKKL